MILIIINQILIIIILQFAQLKISLIVYKYRQISELNLSKLEIMLALYLLIILLCSMVFSLLFYRLYLINSITS